MCAGERLSQLELGAAGDDLPLEVEVVTDELEERQRPRHALDECDGVVAKRRLRAVCLKSLLSATCGTASRLGSIWIRMPVLSE